MFKWADIDQASDRLTGCYVLFDGQPVKVTSVVSEPDATATRREVIVYYQDTATRLHKAAVSDARWCEFRMMPRLGWTNVIDPSGDIQGVHLSRLPVRHRKHGLVRENTKISSINRDTPTRHLNLDYVFCNSGYLNETYPGIDEVVSNALEREVYAISKAYAVYKDSGGLSWLYRHMTRLGLVTEDSGLRLFPKMSYVSDEISEEIPEVFSRVEIL